MTRSICWFHPFCKTFEGDLVMSYLLIGTHDLVSIRMNLQLQWQEVLLILTDAASSKLFGQIWTRRMQICKWLQYRILFFSLTRKTVHYDIAISDEVGGIHDQGAAWYHLMIEQNCWRNLSGICIPYSILTRWCTFRCVCLKSSCRNYCTYGASRSWDFQ